MSYCGRETALVFPSPQDGSLSEAVTHSVSTTHANIVLFADPENVNMVDGSGFEQTSLCGTSGYVFSGTDSRTIATPRFNVPNGGVDYFLSFKLSAGTQGCDGPDDGNNEEVLLEVSYAGSDEFFQLRELPRFTQGAEEIVVPLTDLESFDDVSFRFIQNSFTPLRDIWVLEDVAVAQRRTDPYYFQLELSLDCGRPTDTSTLSVQYQREGSTSWSDIVPFCHPTLCTRTIYSLPSAIRPERFVGQPWIRLTYELPTDQNLRLRVTDDSDGTVLRTFALDNTYVGPCKNVCGGFGRCTLSEVCDCDPGFIWDPKELTCAPETPLPSQLIENFEEDLSAEWLVIGGRNTTGDDACEVVFFGQRMLFDSARIRLLQTPALDTRLARSIEFSSDTGCGSSTFTSNNRPHLFYSTDGGMTYRNLRSIFSNSNTRTTVQLPVEARAKAVRFLFWQSPTSSSNYFWVRLLVLGTCSNPHGRRWMLLQSVLVDH